VFNNMYSQLHDLFSLTKLGAHKDNMKFNVAQVVNILLWNWFSIESTLIIPDFEEGDEGVTKVPPET
jgi:hypothetical protein